MKRLLPPILLLSLLLTGCAPTAAESTPAPSYQATIFAMDTVMNLTIYGGGAQDNCQAVTDEINRLDRLLSVTREESEVWAINHSGGAASPLSSDTLSLLKTASQIGDATGGALDITLYPVVKAWGFTTEVYQIHDGATLSALLEKVDYRSLLLDEEADPATLTLPEGVEIDFGALAKGYAGERCAQLLREAGVTSALLDMGGNIQTVGAKPDGSPWRIGIQDPAGGSEDCVGVVELTDQAAVTSGGYQRYFEADGVRYWHIIDPATGAPARSGLTSATVIGPSGALCDGLSTACFVLGLEGAQAYYQQYGGVELVLVDDSNGVWITPGLADVFTLMEGTGYTLHIMED